MEWVVVTCPASISSRKLANSSSSLISTPDPAVPLPACIVSFLLRSSGPEFRRHSWCERLPGQGTEPCVPWWVREQHHVRQRAGQRSYCSALVGRQPVVERRYPVLGEPVVAGELHDLRVAEHDPALHRLVPVHGLA